jgi:hypothetical protein
MLTVEHQDEVSRFGTIRCIHVSAWTAVPGTNHLTLLRRSVETFVRQPEPIGVLAIVLSTHREISITDTIRGDLSSIFKLTSARRGATAAVIEANGFVGAFVRSLFSGIFLVSRSAGHKKRVFFRRAEALSWLRDELGAASPSAGELDADVAALTRDLT